MRRYFTFSLSTLALSTWPSQGPSYDPNVFVSVLLPQDDIIHFQPALPEPKCGAIKRVQMGNVVKIMLTFKERFWPEEM